MKKFNINIGYVITHILIGAGVILLVSFVKACSVNAETLTADNISSIDFSTYTYPSNAYMCYQPGGSLDNGFDCANNSGAWQSGVSSSSIYGDKEYQYLLFSGVTFGDYGNVISIYLNDFAPVKNNNYIIQLLVGSDNTYSYGFLNSYSPVAFTRYNYDRIQNYQQYLTLLGSYSNDFSLTSNIDYSLLTLKFNQSYVGNVANTNYNYISINLDNLDFTGSQNLRLYGYKITDLGDNDDELTTANTSTSNTTETPTTTTKSVNDSLDDLNQTNQNIFETIVNLPSIIINGLKDLFISLVIPTDEQLDDVLDKSSDLAENFGFFGQGVDFFINIITSTLSTVQSEGCIDLPALTLKFSSISGLNMSDFSVWDEQAVCLADNPWIGEDSIINVIRSVVTMGLLILFLRFCVRAFYHLLDKDDDGTIDKGGESS